MFASLGNLERPTESDDSSNLRESSSPLAQGGDVPGPALYLDPGPRPRPALPPGPRPRAPPRHLAPRPSPHPEADLPRPPALHRPPSLLHGAGQAVQEAGGAHQERPLLSRPQASQLQPPGLCLWGLHV